MRDLAVLKLKVNRLIHKTVVHKPQDNLLDRRGSKSVEQDLKNEALIRFGPNVEDRFRCV
jgi:hypothetical protein